MKNIKKIVAFVLCAVMLVSFAACNKTENKSNKTKITICLDYTPNTNHTGIFVAKAKGFFEKNGLDVTIQQPGDSTAVALCAANKAQFAIGFQDILASAYASENPVNVTAIAALLQHNTSGIISRKGEGMATPKGLENKTYATWDDPTEQAIIKQVMKDEGADFSKVKLIPNNITDEAGALKEHLTDAVWIYYGWSGINAKLKCLDFDYFNFRDINPIFDYYTPVLVGNNDFMEKNPEITKKVLQSIKDGYEFCIENPDEAAEILVNEDSTGSLKDSLDFVKESQRWISTQYKAEVERWGYIDPARWDNFYNWLWNEKLIKVKLPAGTGFTNEYLPE